MTSVATLACGCFWSVQRSFQRVSGVRRVECGYAGGWALRPTYEQICSGSTGHAESVRIWFDPRRVKYEDLLETFWRLHDPT